MDCDDTEMKDETSLVVHWLGSHLPTQGTRAQSLVREQRSHMARSNLAHEAQLLKPVHPGAHAPQQEKPLR